MALNTKINVPILTPVSSGEIFGNYSGEIAKINQLVADTNRSNSGQVTWTSPTSNITYDTSEHSDLSNVYNKGNTGLYNLLIHDYGYLNNGWIVTAEDYNTIASSIDGHTTLLDGIQSGANTVGAAAVATKLTNNTVGSASRPIYLNAGVPTPITSLSLNSDTATDAVYASKIGNSTLHPAIGGSAQPVYINSNGDIVAAIAYSAATVNKANALATPRNLQVALGNTSAVPFDGSAAVSIGVSGVLGGANGGTGASTAAANYVLAGGVSGDPSTPSFRALVADDIPTIPASKIASGSVSVAQGGTGSGTFAANAVLLGNGTSALKAKAAASGALYSTGANVEPQFGVLPAAQGGTGQNDLANVTVGNATLAASAAKLNAARTIALTGAVTASTTWDASGNLSINTTAKNAILYDSDVNVPDAPSDSLGKNGDVYIVYES